jgi:hypothetical protein
MKKKPEKPKKPVKARNERTGVLVANVAGRVLDRLTSLREGTVHAVYSREHGKFSMEVCSIMDLKKLAASCLTQARDKK